MNHSNKSSTIFSTDKHKKGIKPKINNFQMASNKEKAQVSNKLSESHRSNKRGDNKKVREGELPNHVSTKSVYSGNGSHNERIYKGKLSTE